MTMYAFRFSTQLRSFQLAKFLVVMALVGILSLACVPRAASQASLQGQWQTLPNLMPINPLDGKPFGYRLSKGETIESQSGRPAIVLVPGQAILWSEDDPSFVIPEAVWVK